MALRNIRVVFSCGALPGLTTSPEYIAWLDWIRREFAGHGWRLVSQSPATNVDEEAICLESDGAPMRRSVLEAALREVGIGPLNWHGDVEE
jgi:hypothetical protein